MVFVVQCNEVTLYMVSTETNKIGSAENERSRKYWQDSFIGFN